MHLCEWVCLIASYGWNKNRIDTFKIAKFYTLQIIFQPNVACFLSQVQFPYYPGIFWVTQRIYRKLQAPKWNEIVGFTP